MRANPNWIAAGLLAAAMIGIGGVTAVHEARAWPASSQAGSACLSPGAWTSLTGDSPRVTTATAVVTEMVGKDVVLLGEQHDEEDHHRWQMQMLAALHAMRPDMVIGFEMFPRRVQPALDRWVAGEVTAEQFLAETEWESVWSVPAQMYLPLFQFARLNRIPMVALNVERSLTRAVARVGWDAVPEGDREGVGRAAPPAEEYRQFLYGIHRHHHAQSPAMAHEAAFRNFVESQITWDRAMAEALARRAVTRPDGERPLVVGIMGSGHIRHGHGVPHQLRDLGIDKIGTLMPVSLDEGCEDVRPGLVDAVFALPKQVITKPGPVAWLGRQLQRSWRPG